jgi:hypothetical protein
MAIEGAAGEGRTYTWYGVYSIAMLCSAAASLVGGLVGFLFGVPQSVAVGEQSWDRAASVRIDRLQVDQPGSDQQPQHTEQAISRSAAVSEQEQAPAARPGLRHNTNLESISDALTKGLLAIGASQLYKIGDWATGAADMLGPSFGPGSDGRVVAVCVVTYGAIAGLLFGYLATRIYLTPVFGESDPTG